MAMYNGWNYKIPALGYAKYPQTPTHPDTTSLETHTGLQGPAKSTDTGWNPGGMAHEISGPLHTDGHGKKKDKMWSKGR